MDIFKFKNPTNPTLLDQGELINGIKSKLWIERYRELGEFDFTSNIDTMMHLQLPIGTLISHTESNEVMVVENHEINEDDEKQTEIKITGRSFESFLENRIVGSNKNWPTEASGSEEYVLSENFTWDQAVTLIKDHIYLSELIDPEDAILNVEVITNILDTGELFERVVKRGDLYSRLVELMTIDDLGIKIIRPGIRSPLGFDNTNMAMIIHKGQDLSNDITFSHTTGEIKSAEYLWSNKKLKNAALISGRWLETVIKEDSTEYSRRMMFVDASDLDSSYEEAPTEPDRSDILFAMFVRGIAALVSQKDLVLVKAEPIKNLSTYKYREHYEVGDIITVDGQYNETASMRISEYVEIEDENGESGYPTFSSIYHEPFAP